MNVVGFNISKEKISYCLLEGPKASCRLIFHGVEKFNASQPIPEMTNYFREAFSEIINRHKPDGIAYRMSLEGKKASIPYLYFSFGILNLIAFEQGKPVSQSISQSFSAKSLGRKGDKFAVCDDLIADIPDSKWTNEHRYAALAAWMALDA